MASGTKLTPATPVTLSWANTTGQTFRIEYSIDDDYLITAKQTIANTGTAPVAVRSGTYIDRTGKPTDPHEQDSWTIHVGPTGYLDGKSNFTNYDEVEEAANGTVSYSSAGWLGFTDKYWLAAVIPAKGEKVSAAFNSLPGGAYRAALGLHSLPACSARSRSLALRAMSLASPHRPSWIAFETRSIR